MKRLLALRAIEEEREQTELRRQRQLRQACLDALQAAHERKLIALRALHEALDSDDRPEAISAEMALACGPLERRTLQRRLVQLDAMVERASAAWQGSRLRRLQMETLVEAAETRHRREAQTREQKTLDGWFFSSRPEQSAAGAHENSQRGFSGSAEDDGTVRADSIHG
jgi:flagellar biosynthesis chaperone FliJ